MFSYLQFLVKSTNQHGVHSPFVYNYITKGLYEQKKDLSISNKTNQWLTQSIQYFKPNSIFFLDEALSKISWEITINNSVEIKNADLILERYTAKNHKRILKTISNMNPSQLLLIAVHKYPKSFFNDLRKNPEITLVVDFYYGCLLSKRTEQPKQNFFIRY